MANPGFEYWGGHNVKGLNFFNKNRTWSVQKKFSYSLRHFIKHLVDLLLSDKPWCTCQHISTYAEAYWCVLSREVVKCSQCNLPSCAEICLVGIKSTLGGHKRDRYQTFEGSSEDLHMYIFWTPGVPWSQCISTCISCLLAFYFY